MLQPKLLTTAALAVCAAFAARSASAQAPTPRPAPQWLLNAYDVSDGTVQDLSIPTLRERFQFPVVLGDAAVTVELDPNDIRTLDFALFVDDGTQLTRMPTPAAITFIGKVLGHPHSTVAASIVDRKLQALVRLDDDASLIWGIESVAALDPQAPIADHLVYRSDDSTRQQAHCGTTHPHWHAIGGPGTDARKEAEIACDADLEFYQRNGSNVVQTTNTITSIVNGIDVIYRRDVDVQYVIRQIIVRTTAVYVNNDMGALLSEFATRWNGNHGGVPRDLAHLFTGKGSFGGVVGIAYVGVVCDLGSAYGVSKAFSNFTTNVGLVAHETGHNWNAPHCDGINPCYIMCSGLGGCNGNVTLFDPSTVGVITSFKNSRGCLATPPVVPVIGGISPGNAAVLPSSAITLTGTGFSGVTTVTVGTTPVTPYQVTDTQVRFQSPLPTALGTVAVRVTNPAGTSNAVNLTLNAASPPVYLAPALATGGVVLPLQWAGDPSDVCVLLASFNDATTIPIGAFNLLANNFVLAVAPADGVGHKALGYAIPSISLSGLVMRSQVVFLDETSLGLNSISTIILTTFL